MKRVILLILLTVLLGIGGLTFTIYRDYFRYFGGSDPEVIVTSSLKGLQEQSKLVPFTARFVAVVTAKTARFGLLAQKTLILPGTVRYELDLSKLQQKDLSWDGDANKLTVHLPPLQIAGPEVDLTAIREYRDGKIVMLLTDAEDQIDALNRAAGTKKILEQASEETPMRLARNAAKTAIESSFALPMHAAGHDASVVALFAGDKKGAAK